MRLGFINDQHELTCSPAPHGMMSGGWAEELSCIFFYHQAFKNGLVGLDEDESETPPAKRKPGPPTTSSSHSKSGEIRKKIADSVVKALTPYYKEKRISSKV